MDYREIGSEEARLYAPALVYFGGLSRLHSNKVSSLPAQTSLKLCAGDSSRVLRFGCRSSVAEPESLFQGGAGRYGLL